MASKTEPTPKGPLTDAEAIAWLTEAAKNFAKRDTRGEDRAHWSNVYNAENCAKIVATLQRLTADLAEARTREMEAQAREAALTEVLAETVSALMSSVEQQAMPDDSFNATISRASATVASTTASALALLKAKDDAERERYGAIALRKSDNVIWQQLFASADLRAVTAETKLAQAERERDEALSDLSTMRKREMIGTDNSIIDRMTFRERMEKAEAALAKASQAIRKTAEAG